MTIFLQSMVMTVFKHLLRVMHKNKLMVIFLQSCHRTVQLNMVDINNSISYIGPSNCFD